MALSTTTMAVMAAVSTAVSMAGTYSQAKAAKNMADTEAELARRQAERERQIGTLQASRQRERSKRVEGTQRALLAGNTADASKGSALLVQEALAEEGKFNEQLAKNNAAARADAFEAERVMSSQRAKNDLAAGYTRMGTTLLSGGTKIAKLYR